MRHSDNGDFEHGWVPVQHFLDLPRVDIDPTADDHVLASIDDVQEAVFVERADIAGPEPAVAQRFGGGLWIVPVALHHGLAAQHDFARLALGYIATLIVHHPQPDPNARPPD